MRSQTATKSVAWAALGVLAAVLSGAGHAQAQIVSQNVNMVSGTQWPGGDPFLQRQNEPSHGRLVPEPTAPARRRQRLPNR